MPLRIGTSSWPAALTTAKVRTQTLYMWQVPYDGMVVLCTPEKSVASRLMHPAILSASYTAHVCGQRVFAAAPSFVCRSGAQTAKNDLGVFPLGYTKDACEVACAQDPKCVSFDASTRGECHLSSTRAGGKDGGGIRSSPGFTYCERSISEVPSGFAEASGWACASSAGGLCTDGAGCDLSCCRGCGCMLKKVENAEDDHMRVAVCEVADEKGDANYQMCAAPRTTPATNSTKTTALATTTSFSKTISSTPMWGSLSSTSAAGDARGTGSAATDSVGASGNSSIGSNASSVPGLQESSGGGSGSLGSIVVSNSKGNT